MSDASEAASAALHYVLQCETAGDFTGFSVAERSRAYAAYYLGPTT